MTTPVFASHPARGLPEISSATPAPMGLNLGPFRITGQVVLLADEAPLPLGPLGPTMPSGTPGAAPGAARIDELVMRLGSPDFREREAAHAELRRLARRIPSVVQALVQAFDAASDPEARLRIQDILKDLSGEEAQGYAEQARILFGNLLAIRERFPNGSDLEEEARADLNEALDDIKAARQDRRRSGVDARRRRAEERERRFEERRRRLNPLGDFFGPK